MKKTIIRADSLEEMRIHGDINFPYTIYHEEFNFFYKETADLHWHQEIEFQYISQGNVYAQIDGKICSIPEGDGLFINSNTLHMTKALYPGIDTKYCSYIFHPEILGTPSSSVYIHNILPILEHPSLRFLHLHKDIEWENEILKQLIKLSSPTATSKKTSYIYTIAALSEIWKILLENTELSQTETTIPMSDSISKQRTASMITYIHEHYGDNITINDLISFSGISRSECFRCFQKYVGNKPIEYLNQYRLSRTAELLRTTDLSITEIFLQCGFNNQSYFGKLFLKNYNISPAQYRKKYQNLNNIKKE